MIAHKYLLYVAGGGDLAHRARANFERTVLPALDRAGIDETSLTFEVIDVAEEPERARAASVITTPMLIRLSPGPTVRLLGTLDDAEHVLPLLDLDS